MKLESAIKLIAEIMGKYLNMNIWSFKLIRAKGFLAQCIYSTKTIEFSKYFLELNSKKLIKDVILHELSHALCDASCGHDETWKSKCIELGANPTRLIENVKLMPGAYQATCPQCNKIFNRYRPPPKGRKYRCNVCDEPIKWKRNKASP
jgi:predicted SprT family Zn-dependent metalloprotease